MSHGRSEPGVPYSRGGFALRTNGMNEKNGRPNCMIERKMKWAGWLRVSCRAKASKPKGRM